MGPAPEVTTPEDFGWPEGVVLTVGAVVTFGPFLAKLPGMEDPSTALVAVGTLYSPYLGLAVLGPRAKLVVAGLALLLLVL